MTSYWPPIFPSNEYGHNPELVVSEEEYLQILIKNPSLVPDPALK